MNQTAGRHSNPEAPTPTSPSTMNSFRIRAYFNYFAGKAEEALGRALRDSRRQLKGFQRKSIGAALLTMGDAQVALAASVRVPRAFVQNSVREKTAEAQERAAQRHRLRVNEISGKTSRS